jgi:hypothetical protein
MNTGEIYHGKCMGERVRERGLNCARFPLSLTLVWLIYSHDPR